jgi:selenide,water dikinase
VAERSGVRIAIDPVGLPVLDGAVEAAAANVRTSGDPRNREFVGDALTVNGTPEAIVALGFDPQTAGGLLVSLPADRVPALEAEFGARDLFIRRIGRVEEGAGVVLQ